MLGNSAAEVRVRYSALASYGVALVAVLAAVAVRFALQPLLAGHAPLLLFALSVMVAARFGGVAPGLFATALSLAIGSYFFLAPYNRFVIEDPADATYLTLFAAVGVGISLISGQLRGAMRTSAETAERYYTLSEAVPQLVWTCGPEGCFDFLNARWLEYTGMPKSRQLGSGWAEQLHPDDRDRVLRAWNDALARGVDFQVECRIRRHDGAWRWFDTRAVPLRDSAGRILKWFGSNTDIHEAHMAREALRFEQERLERIVATAPGVICAFRRRPDGTACMPYASPGIRDLYGLEAADLREDATPVLSRIHPDDAAHVQATITESARMMLPWRDEYRFRHPTRGEIWVEGHSQPARQPDGSIEWYGFVADVTQRHAMEQALRDRSARLEELTRTLEVAHALITTLDGTIKYWSAGAAAMYGWQPDEAIGHRSHDLLRTEFPTPLQGIYAALHAAGHWEGELRHYRRDGTPVVVASHWTLHYDERGEPVSVVEVNNDISGQKRVESELRASERGLALAQQAAGVASWDWDISSDTIHYSGPYGPLYGLPADAGELSSARWLEFVHPDDRERIRAEVQRALEGQAQYDVEFRVIAPGGTRWLLGKGEVFRDSGGRPVRMLGVNMDITERKAAAEQLRALSASLIHAQEEERRRISRELHDDLTQRLCAMAIDLGRLATRPPEPGAPMLEELRFLQERAVQSAELTRHMAHELHPSILDDLGIESALRSHCEEFARREELELEFTSSDLPPSIRREIASCLYSVAQEALLNISKHAQARRVLVHLGGGCGAIRLSILDDGVGFAPRPGGAFGLGIVNMRERVRWANGTFSVESQPGHGTRVAVEIPLGGAAHEAPAHSAG